MIPARPDRSGRSEDGGWVMRKIMLRFLLVAALVLCALPGCGPGEGVTGDKPDTTGRPAEEAEAPAPRDVAEAAAAGIDESSIRTHLARLTGASPAPLDGREVTISERGTESGRRAAAGYMKSSFEEMGIPARIHEFRSGGLRGFNVEATLRGTGDGRHLWVTAHLDSVHNAGANDDASGLTSILLTAKALEEIGPEHTVHFVAYDLEEVGLFGSTHHVENTVKGVVEREGERAIIGALQSDMIAYEEGRVRRGARDLRPGRSHRRRPLPGSGGDRLTYRPQELCLGRSDHEPFWDAGLPAAVLTDGASTTATPATTSPATPWTSSTSRTCAR